MYYIGGLTDFPMYWKNNELVKLSNLYGLNRLWGWTTGCAGLTGWVGWTGLAGVGVGTGNWLYWSRLSWHCWLCIVYRCCWVGFGITGWGTGSITWWSSTVSGEVCGKESGVLFLSNCPGFTWLIFTAPLVLFGVVAEQLDCLCKERLTGSVLFALAGWLSPTGFNWLSGNRFCIVYLRLNDDWSNSSRLIGIRLVYLRDSLKAWIFFKVFSLGISLIIAEPSLKTTTHKRAVASNWATTWAKSGLLLYQL